MKYPKVRQLRNTLNFNLEETKDKDAWNEFAS
jgi:hypothetical protein